MLPIIQRLRRRADSLDGYLSPFLMNIKKDLNDSADCLEEIEELARTANIIIGKAQAQVDALTVLAEQRLVQLNRIKKEQK